MPNRNDMENNFEGPLGVHLVLRVQPRFQEGSDFRVRRFAFPMSCVTRVSFPALFCATLADQETLDLNSTLSPEV